MSNLPRKVRRNLMEPPEQPEAVMVETDTKFHGQKVFILVPISTGIDPKELAQQFTEQLNEVVKVAQSPTNGDIIRMSADAIPTMTGRALSMEN